MLRIQCKTIKIKSIINLINQSKANQMTMIIDHMPACVEEMGAPSGPMEAGRVGSPMAAAGRTSSKMEGLGQIHQDRSRDLLLWVDLHSNFPGPSAHSTSPHGCSKEGREGEAGLDQREAREGQV